MQHARWSLALILVAATFLPLSMAHADAARARDLLEEIDRLGQPESISLSVPKQEFQDFLARRKEQSLRRAALILELYQDNPQHERIPELMLQRWRLLCREAKNAASLPNEINLVLFGTKNQEFRIQGLTAKARVMMLDPAQRDEARQVINLVIRLEGPQGKLGPELLHLLAVRWDPGSPTRNRLEDRILRDYPETSYARLTAGQRRRTSAIGKPFDLTFRDAISGKTISTRDMRGKVVIIDFWATWCSPCVDMVPHLKKLYQQYHDQGVEFIGVSVDSAAEKGGLNRLKEFVAKHSIPWPQYHPAGSGTDGDPEYSRSWGIEYIPTTFAVDAEGRLAWDGSNRPLEKVIPELLDRARATASTKASEKQDSQKRNPSRSKKRGN